MTKVLSKNTDKGLVRRYYFRRTDDSKRRIQFCGDASDQPSRDSILSELLDGPDQPCLQGGADTSADTRNH